MDSTDVQHSMLLIQYHVFLASIPTSYHKLFLFYGVVQAKAELAGVDHNHAFCHLG
jgi:hypothetical protein